MKKTYAFIVAASAALTLQSATVDRVIVRQQWPWSDGIKVEYKISGMTCPVNIAVRAFDGETEFDAQKLRAAITGKLFGVSNTVGAFTIDPAQAFGTGKTKIDRLEIKLELTDAPDSDEVLYRVFDLTSATPSHEDITRAQILNGEYGTYETDFSKIGSGFTTALTDVLIWTGVTNEVYKTTKLAMRKIPAGGKVWRCGGGTGTYSRQETQRYIKLTEDYFIGVFELTQKQWQLINGDKPSHFTGLSDSDRRPVENVKYFMRGNPVKGNYGGVVNTSEIINWPTNSYLHDVGRYTFMANARTKTGWEFDLPTEAQWEYACRAGTDTPVYNGKAEPSTQAAAYANVYEVAWTYAHGATTHEVGLKACNAFGLYDMLGNVMEQCLNAGSLWQGGADGSGDGKSVGAPIIDPVGKTDVANYDASNRNKRGGSFGSNPDVTTNVELTNLDCTTFAVCVWYQWYQGRSDMGVRLVCPVNAQWEPHD